MTAYRGKRTLPALAFILAIFTIGFALGSLLSCVPAAEPEQTEQSVEVEEPMAVEPEADEPVATEYAVLQEPAPEVIDLGEFKITHYCACEKCCGKWADGITATGTVATQGRTIAVDPDVIPYGTEVVLRYEDGTEAVYIAEDCGGAIQGNRIDVYMDSHQAALEAGVKTARVTITKE